ncbi:hypothetical protein NKG94_04955 [Micromonospora sp. M12]
MLEDLKPDLILTQDLCDVCAVSYQRVNDAVGLIDLDTRVMSLEARTIDGILDTVDAVAALTGTEGRAAEIRVDAEQRLAALPGSVAGAPTVLFVEWLDPLMPGGHWVPEQISYAGGRSLLLGPGAHSTPHHWSVVADLAPTWWCSGRAGSLPSEPSTSCPWRPRNPAGRTCPRFARGRCGSSTGLPTSTAPARGSSTARRSSPPSSPAGPTPRSTGFPRRVVTVAGDRLGFRDVPRRRVDRCRGARRRPAHEVLGRVHAVRRAHRLRPR